MVHDRGYLIAAPPGGGFAFYRPDGTPLPTCPPLPEPDGGIDTAHDADITPDTIIPPWYGERLDLDHAIWACFANARTRQEPEPDDAPANRGRVTIYEPEDCDERYRQYLEHAPRYTGPTPDPDSGLTNHRDPVIPSQLFGGSLSGREYPAAGDAAGPR